jgi:PAS domain S-box-containing protein
LLPDGPLPLRSCLATPVVSRSGDVLGGLFLGHSKAGAFDQYFRRLTELLAAQTALALDNLRLSGLLQHERSQSAANEQRYRFLTESIPQIVWTALPDGSVDYFNMHWTSYTGLSMRTSLGWGWQAALHPDDLQPFVLRWKQAAETGDPFEAEYRLRRESDGSYRWHLARALAMQDQNAQIVRWFGTSTDIHDQKRAEETLQFLAGATTILGTSLDYETTLKNVANLVVPGLADWCAIDLVDDRGSSNQLTVVHSDPAKVEWAMELQRRYPPDPNAAYGLPNVLRTGSPELASEISDEALAAAARDAEHLDMLRRLNLKSYMIVPLIARGRILGAITLVMTESGRRYAPNDLTQVEHLARRAAAAVDNAVLYQAAQQEIVERKRVEEELRQSKEQLEIIFRNVADGITLQEPSGGLIYANDVAARLIGYPSVQALLATPIQKIMENFDVMDETGQPFPAAQLPGRLALHGKQTAEMTVRFRIRATGEERWSVVKAIPIFDARGAVRFAINITRDITEQRSAEQVILALNAALEQRVIERTAQLKATNKMLEAEIAERKRAEEALREANDKLETRVRERTSDLKAANDELSTFTYIVSHDLRSPLVNLKGFSAELRSAVGVISEAIDGASPYLPESQAEAVNTAIQKDIPEALEYIDSAVNRMDHLTSAVLKLSRLGRRDLNFEQVDMNSLVQHILNSLAHQIKAQQVSVTVAALPPVVADRLAMEQIMANLLSNAVLYVSPDRPAVIEVTGERTSDEVTYHVRDNGRGIADDDKHKVFEPFRRAGKSNVPGEGMGLAYVQTLVRRHGGRIWYTSHPGVGSTFSFMILNNFAKGTDTHDTG